MSNYNIVVEIEINMKFYFSATFTIKFKLGNILKVAFTVTK